MEEYISIIIAHLLPAPLINRIAIIEIEDRSIIAHNKVTYTPAMHSTAPD